MNNRISIFEQAKKHPVVTYLGTVLAVFMAGFGGHVKFIELTGQETVLRDTITRITAERDGFSAKLAGALKENAEIRRLNPMIEQFGPDVSEFHVFDIARDSGGALQIGRCPSEHCLTVHVDGPSRRENTPFANFRLSGRWGPLDTTRGLFQIELTILKGCRFTALLGSDDITFAVIDDRAAYTRVAAAVTPGSGKIALKGVTCPDGGG